MLDDGLCNQCGVVEVTFVKMSNSVRNSSGSKDHVLYPDKFDLF